MKVYFNYKKDSSGQSFASVRRQDEQEELIRQILSVANEVFASLQSRELRPETLEEVSALMEELNGEFGCEPVGDKFNEQLSAQDIAALLNKVGQVVKNVQVAQNRQLDVKLMNAAMGLFCVIFKLLTEKLYSKDGARGYELADALREQEKILEESKSNCVRAAVNKRQEMVAEDHADPYQDTFGGAGDGLCLTSTSAVAATSFTVGLAAAEAVPPSVLIAMGSTSFSCCCVAYLCGGKDYLAGAMEGTQTQDYYRAKKKYFTH